LRTFVHGLGSFNRENVLYFNLLWLETLKFLLLFKPSVNGTL